MDPEPCNNSYGSALLIIINFFIIIIILPGAGLRMRQTSVLPSEVSDEQSPSAAPSSEDREGGPTVYHIFTLETLYKCIVRYIGRYFLSK